MTKITHHSLAKRLTVLSTVLISTTLLVVTGIVYLTIVSFGNKFLENELKEKSDFIQKAFAVPIWTYDQYQINEIGNSLLSDAKYTYVSALKVETTNNEVLFEKTQEIGSDYLKAAALPYTKTKVIDIFKDQRKIGMISVAMTNYGYIKSFRDQFIIIMIAIVILMVVISKLASYYINKTLTIPLTKILKHVNLIEDEDYTHHEIENLPRELDSISRALNQAASVIEKRNSDIKYYTNDLEQLVRDRTQALEEQLIKNLNTARLAAVGEMAADVAHEINNPLTVIDLHTMKLKKMDTDLPPNVMNSVDKVQAMVKRIGKIIKGLRSLSRDGHADPMVPFSVMNMIEDVKMLVEMKVKSHEIDFEIIVTDPGIHAIGREVQISQVLVNIVGNAIDAVTNLPDKWIKVEVKEVGDEVHFFVTDCGRGIPKDLQDKIMHPFFTTKGVNKGTGLGLSISKNIIEEHGGVLKYNVQNSNTQFIFTLKKGIQV